MSRVPRAHLLTCSLTGRERTGAREAGWTRSRATYFLPSNRCLREYKIGPPLTCRLASTDALCRRPHQASQRVGIYASQRAHRS